MRIRPDNHSPVVARADRPIPTGSFDVTDRIRDTLFFNLFTFAVITAVLIWHRIRLENLVQRVSRRKMEVLAEL